MRVTSRQLPYTTTKSTLAIDGQSDETKTARQMLQGGKMIEDTLESVVQVKGPSFRTHLLRMPLRLKIALPPMPRISENRPIGGPRPGGLA